MSMFRDHLNEQEKVIIVYIFPVGVSAVKANSGYVWIVWLVLEQY